MSPSGRPENMLTTSGTFQSAGYTHQDDESQYEWNDTICILLESGRFISIIGDLVELREFDKLFGPKIEDGKTFFKMRVGTKPGSSWCKILDWEFEDYNKVLKNEYVMDRLKNNITPNPTYISEMKSSFREYQLNKIIDNT